MSLLLWINPKTSSVNSFQRDYLVESSPTSTVYSVSGLVSPPLLQILAETPAISLRAAEGPDPGTEVLPACDTSREATQEEGGASTEQPSWLPPAGWYKEERRSKHSPRLSRETHDGDKKPIWSLSGHLFWNLTDLLFSLPPFRCFHMIFLQFVLKLFKLTYHFHCVHIFPTFLSARNTCCTVTVHIHNSYLKAFFKKQLTTLLPTFVHLYTLPVCLFPSLQSPCTPHTYYSL